MIKKVLQEIGLSKVASRVYLTLLEKRSSSTRELSENLGIPRPSVYDNLKILTNMGLVFELEKENKKIFAAEDINTLKNLLKGKIDFLKNQEIEIKNFLPKFNINQESLEPKVRMFSGVKGIKYVLSDLLWYKNIQTLTMWPISEMVEILGKEYLENLNRRRIKNGISIRGIWPQDKKVDFQNHPFLGVGKGHLRKLRLAPKGMTWEMSYWLYADKVAFISSRKECFGFLIHSRDFAELLKSQFQVIWPICIPIKPQPKYTDRFLQTLTR